MLRIDRGDRDDLNRAFMAKHPGVPLQPTYGDRGDLISVVRKIPLGEDADAR